MSREEAESPSDWIDIAEKDWECESRVEREQEHRCREPTEGVNH